ncbi:MAG: DnaJ domain-containing protein, partial [Labilithrix sp.]|nr:DnaJ domain-containing protein [Labilithrix sp.]
MAEKVPRLLPGVDIKKLKLDATDGFLLTRIDGKLAPKDLSRETGLPDFSVDRALEKLVKLGVIEIVDPNAPPPAPPAPPEEKKPAFDIGLLAPKYDPQELEEPSDLTPEQKKKILDYFYRLEDLDYYMLLGVEKDADKKTIRRAYNPLAATFHPDRYFKKELGSFKAKMTEVFTKITEAHDVLVDPDKRAEYDAYMAEVETTRGMEAMLERAM